MTDERFSISVNYFSGDQTEDHEFLMVTAFQDETCLINIDDAKEAFEKINEKFMRIIEQDYKDYWDEYEIADTVILKASTDKKYIYVSFGFQVLTVETRSNDGNYRGDAIIDIFNRIRNDIVNIIDSYNKFYSYKIKTDVDTIRTKIKNIKQVTKRYDDEFIVGLSFKENSTNLDSTVLISSKLNSVDSTLIHFILGTKPTDKHYLRHCVLKRYSHQGLFHGRH